MKGKIVIDENTYVHKGHSVKYVYKEDSVEYVHKGGSLEVC
jgi:hypothetical protein